jgi:hypothetical protein
VHHRRGGKNPSEKRTDVAKQLGLPPSTLNTIIVKKIREHACLWTRSLRHVVCCVWKKCVVRWEVEVAWRCKVVLVVLSFMEALRAFESMRVFMYAHDITERGQAILKFILQFEKERSY